ncbi:MAG: hypothetical protein KIG35_08480, partial [Prevotellamassilia sp.]|nr:hypothetical protein [Prevotellamassilia sp.]
IYMVRAQKKENKTNQAREWDRATREPNNGTKRDEQRNKESRTTKQRESDNETKRDEQRNKESRTGERGS